MAKGNAGRVLKKALIGLGAGILGILVCLAVYLGCVLLQPEPGEQPEQPAQEERLQAGDFTDLALLEASFGAGVPFWQGVTLNGQTRNGQFENAHVRELDVHYLNGMRVRAVTPASAAPMIQQKQYDLLLNRDLFCLEVPCALAEKDGCFAVYFEKGRTAYCVSMDNTDETTFLAMLDRMEIRMKPEE